MVKTIVTAPGSLGDVNPMLAIARALRENGHDVIFLAAEHYLDLARRAGLETRTLITEAQLERLVGNPKVWHPRHGARLLLQEVVAYYLEDHYNWLESTFEPGQAILVSHVLDLAGRVYRDRYPQTKFVSVLPAPSLMRSRTAPPRLSGFTWERWLPSAVIPTLYRAADIWVDRIGAPQINRLRKRIGLPPVSRILDRWWWSPDLVIALFPEWFSIPKSDLWPQVRLVGFPLADSADVLDETVAKQMQELDAFIARSGDVKPIVFAPGTAHYHAGRFFQMAVNACQQLARPAVLLSPAADQFPERLPPGIMTANYLPFSQLLPRASAIVHHGGVGTTSQALRAGVPQFVVPMAFDQFDNAERVQRLGCGTWKPMQGLTQYDLVKHLSRVDLLTDQCATLAGRVTAQPDANRRSAELISELTHSAPLAV